MSELLDDFTLALRAELERRRNEEEAIADPADLRSRLSERTNTPTNEEEPQSALAPLDADVAPFAQDLAAVLEMGADRRRLEAMPPAPRPRRKVGWAVAAAVALLILGGTVAVRAVVSDTADAPSSQAVHQATPAKPETPVLSVPRSTPPAAVGVATSAAAEDDQDDADEAEPTPSRPPSPKRTGPSLSELERLAAQAWRAKDLERAEKLFRQVIRRAGKTRRAELAYADLVAVVRQARGRAGQATVWRQYLRAFPKGQFADDAKAGLCRGAASAGRKQACWAEYLARFPKGTAVDEARRGIGGSAP